MKYFYPIYLSNMSILFCSYQTEVPFEFLIIEVRISDVLKCSKHFNLKQDFRFMEYLSTIESSSLFFFLLSFYKFSEFNEVNKLQRFSI